MTTTHNRIHPPHLLSKVNKVLKRPRMAEQQQQLLLPGLRESLLLTPHLPEGLLILGLPGKVCSAPGRCSTSQRPAAATASPLHWYRPSSTPGCCLAAVEAKVTATCTRGLRCLKQVLAQLAVWCPGICSCSCTRRQCTGLVGRDTLLLLLLKLLVGVIFEA